MYYNKYLYINLKKIILSVDKSIDWIIFNVYLTYIKKFIIN